MISVGSYEIKRNHLLVIGILVLAFSISFLIRVQPMDYGFELNEFDPFFNYRATQFLVENGFEEYFNWHDSLSWHPGGRNVTYDSQVMLHVTAAITYWIFGGNNTLHDFIVLFPVVIGSLTVVAIFALVRTIAGTTAGLFSALLFAVSMPILLRGPLGWFKSEPLGLFFGIIAIYLFLNGISPQNRKITIGKLIGAGLLLTLSISAWGGLQFFFIPLTIFIISLPFFRSDHKFLLWSIPLFTLTTLLISLSFERLSEFVSGIEGVVLIVANVVMVLIIFIQQKSKYNKQRNAIAFLFAVTIIGGLFFIINYESEFLELPNHRYLNAVNPFLTTSDPLVDSISEHTATSLNESFYFHSSLMILAGIGVWVLLTKQQSGKYIIKKDMIAFALIISLIGVYTSSAFIRLEIFASLSVIILSSISLSIIIRNFLQKNNSQIRFQTIVKPVLIIGIIILLVIPLIIPSTNWITGLIVPPTIMNGGSLFNTTTNDWKDAMNWIKDNTPKDAVVVSWWDYGYWIQTLGERTTIVDNATLSTETIARVATMFLSTPDSGWTQLNELDADFLLVFVAAERVEADTDFPVYFLDGGGDESKKHWIMHIAGEPLEKYLHIDGQSGKKHFWDNTILGQTMPFSPLLYVDFKGNMQSEQYRPGFLPVYKKDISFADGENEPLKLVYSSPSFNEDKIGPIIGVFIYEVNKDYVPLNN